MAPSPPTRSPSKTARRLVPRRLDVMSEAHAKPRHDALTRRAHTMNTTSVQTHILRVQKTMLLFPLAYYVRGTGCLSFGNLPMTSTCLNQPTNIMQSEEQSTIDGYLTYLSESTDLDDALTHTQLTRRGYADRLLQAVTKIGAKYRVSIQVWGSNSGFYELTFTDTEDYNYVSVTTRLLELDIEDNSYASH